MAAVIAIQHHSITSLTQTCRDYDAMVSGQHQQIEHLQQAASKAKQSIAFWQMVATQPPNPQCEVSQLTSPEEEVSDNEVLEQIVQQFGSSEESGPGN